MRIEETNKIMAKVDAAISGEPFSQEYVAGKLNDISRRLGEGYYLRTTIDRLYGIDEDPPMIITSEDHGNHLPEPCNRLGYSLGLEMSYSLEVFPPAGDIPVPELGIQQVFFSRKGPRSSCKVGGCTFEKYLSDNGQTTFVDPIRDITVDFLDGLVQVRCGEEQPVEIRSREDLTNFLNANR